MAKENLALEVLETGVDPEMQTEGVSCCWTMFTYFDNTTW